MREKKTLRKVWPFETWQLEQAEEWLEGMASQGWMLQSCGIKHMRFVRQESSLTKYRCVSRYQFDTAINEEKCEDQFKQAGWKYIDYSFRTLIFNADQGCPVVEGYTFDLRNRLKIIRNMITLRIIFLLTIILACTVFIYQNTATVWNFIEFLSTNNVTSLSIIILLLLCAINSIWSIVYFLLERARLKEYVNDQQSMRASRVSRSRKPFCFYSMLIVILLGIAGFAYDKTSHFIKVQELPANVVVLEITDILQSSETDFFPGSMKVIYYEDHELLFPDNYSLHCIVNIDRKSDNDIQYSYIDEYISRALTPALAMFISEQSNSQSKYYTIQEPEHLYGFDKIWCYNDKWTHNLKAVRGVYTYSIYYIGNESTDDLIKALAKKIEEKENAIK